jgi:hypothetical protein
MLIECCSLTLDRFITDLGIGRVPVTKIDVDDSEGLVLYCAEGMLSNPNLKPKLIIVELVDDYLSAFKTSIE